MIRFLYVFILQIKLNGRSHEEFGPLQFLIKMQFEGPELVPRNATFDAKSFRIAKTMLMTLAKEQK